MRYKKSVHKSFAMISQVGISMLVPIFLCCMLGLFLENKFGFHFSSLVPLRECEMFMC